MATSQDFVNPFSSLTRTQFDFINIRKLVSYFPRSLRTNILASEELLEFLSTQVEARDITIEELRNQLLELDTSSVNEEFNTSLNELLNGLNEELTRLDISDTISEANTQAVLSGFTRHGNTGIYYKIDGLGEAGQQFYLLSKDEEGGENDQDEYQADEGLLNPSQIQFANISEFDIVVKKYEGSSYSGGDNRWAGYRAVTYTNLQNAGVFRINERATGALLTSNSGVILPKLGEGGIPTIKTFNISTTLTTEKKLVNAGFIRPQGGSASYQSKVTFDFTTLPPLIFDAKIGREYK